MASKKREYGDYLKRMAAIEREKVNLDRRRIMNAEIAAKYPHYNGGSPEFQAQEKANYFKGRAVDRADLAQTLDENRFKFSKVRHADDVALRGRRLDILSEKNLNDFKLGQGNINLGLDRLNFDRTAFFQELGFKRSAFARDLELKNRVQKATEYDRSWNTDPGLSDTGDPLKRSGTYMQGLEAYREGGTGGLSSQPLDTAIAMKLKSAGGDPSKVNFTEAELAHIRKTNPGALAPKGSAKKVVSPAASPRTLSQPGTEPLTDQKRWPSPVKNRMAHFRHNLNRAQDDTAFKKWLNSGTNYSRKAMTDRMKNKKTPD